MTEYTLHFQLTKHKDAKHFNTKVIARDDADIQGIKEVKAMYFEDMYHTPVRCVKIDRRPINVTPYGG